MADSVISKQELIDAQKDAKSLEDVVNGNETKQVTTRLGETYPSVKKAIKTLFENGGLPATPFTSLDAMQQSDLSDNAFAVLLDTGESDGLYKKQSGVWLKTDYKNLGHRMDILEKDRRYNTASNINFTNLSTVFDNYKNVYDKKNNISSKSYIYYQDLKLTPAEGAVIHRLPVKPHEQLIINQTSANLVVAGSKDGQHTLGTLLKPIKYNTIPSVGTIVKIPDDIHYLYFNVTLPQIPVDWIDDIKIVSFKPDLVELSGSSLSDVFIRNKIENTFKAEGGQQLNLPLGVYKVLPYYVGIADSVNHKKLVAPIPDYPAKTFVFKVDAGSQYSVSTAFADSIMFVPVGSDAYTEQTGVELKLVPLTKLGENKGAVLNIPEDVNFLYINAEYLLTGNSPIMAYRFIDDHLIVKSDKLVEKDDEISQINGFNLVDNWARRKLSTTISIDDLGGEGIIVNRIIDGAYVGIAGSATPYKITPAATTHVSYVYEIKVKPNTDYCLTTKSINSIILQLIESTTQLSKDDFGTPITLNPASISNSRFFRTSSDANYIYLTAEYSFFPEHKVFEDFWLNEGKESTSPYELGISEIKGFSVVDKVARENQISSSLRGKTWCVIGDSISNHSTPYNSKNYQVVVSESVGGMNLINKGVSGSGFYSRPDVASELDFTSPDYITLAFGTNDQALPERHNMPLGEYPTRDTSTLAGTILICIEGIIKKHPSSKFGVLLPIPRMNSYGDLGDGVVNNILGYSLKDVVDLIEQCAHHFSLPVLDLYRESGLQPWLPESADLFYKLPGGSIDGVHLNDAGQARIADKIKAFLESM